MRTIKELLQLMLDNQEHFVSGLCSWAFYLCRHGKINNLELMLLDRYIKTNKPSKWSSFDAFSNSLKKSDWYWKYGNIKPRVEWINKHIKIN